MGEDNIMNLRGYFPVRLGFLNSGIFMKQLYYRTSDNKYGEF